MRRQLTLEEEEEEEEVEEAVATDFIEKLFYTRAIAPGRVNRKMALAPRRTRLKNLQAAFAVGRIN